MNVRWHLSALQRGLYGIQPIGTRQHRNPSIAEVLHFQTCWAAGAYSAVNCQVPAGVPVWQYVDAAEREAAARKSAPFLRIEEARRAMHGRFYGDTSAQDRAAIARIDARRAA